MKQKAARVQVAKYLLQCPHCYEFIVPEGTGTATISGGGMFGEPRWQVSYMSTRNDGGWFADDLPESVECSNCERVMPVSGREYS